VTWGFCFWRMQQQRRERAACLAPVSVLVSVTGSDGRRQRFQPWGHCREKRMGCSPLT
jgi:hypothetical protein